MKWADLAVEAAYPFVLDELPVEDRKLWRKLPADLRAVLRKTNGATLTRPPWFATKITTVRDGKPQRGQTNCLKQLWAFLPRSQRVRDDGPRSILGEHFGRHMDEHFLPRGVFVFGECEQSCLVAVSTNRHDYGAIYYWEWYWQYPWCRAFFEARLDKARKRWPNRKTIDEGHADYGAMFDDFNYATLVKVAPSFTAWVGKMKPDGE